MTYAARILAFAASSSLLALASAGTFQLSPGSWGSFAGTSSGDSSLFSTNSDEVGATIKLTAPSLSQSGTLSGTYSFTVTWTPATGDTPPANAVVTFGRLSTLTVAGDGSASIANGTTILDSMDSSDLYLSGCSTVLDNVTVTVPLTLQTDGTYKGSGSLVSDTLSANFNTQTAAITTCEESFDLQKIVGSN